MSRWLALIFLGAWPAGPALAQQVYGPVEPSAQEDEDDPPPVASRPCEAEVGEEGAILVCRELPDTERYRSPLPRPVQSDRTIIPGLTDPPCWVTNPELVGTSACIRMGWAPPPAIMVDFTQFPEDLTAEEASRVVAAEMAAPGSEAATGERVPIDLSDD